ncbi:MAG: helix-turn-helix transcriptional regulator [Selenomonadaceae bacterium]|nr:helix-turn-helix transcriptional regulator [Selenomonadaceae bacterium]
METLDIPAAFARYREKFGLSKAGFAREIGIAPQSYDYETPSSATCSVVKSYCA